MKPTVGMGATSIVGSDRYPFTVVEVKTEKTIVIQEDNAKIVKGHGNDGSAEYEYTPNPSDVRVTLRWSEKRQLWFELGHPRHIFHVGKRRKYLDPSF